MIVNTTFYVEPALKSEFEGGRRWLCDCLSRLRSVRVMPFSFGLPTMMRHGIGTTLSLPSFLPLPPSDGASAWFISPHSWRNLCDDAA